MKRKRSNSIVNWRQIRAFTVLGMMPIVLLGLIPLLNNSIKPTAGYVENSFFIARVAPTSAFLIMSGIAIASFRDKMLPKQSKLGVLLLPLVFAFYTYQIVLYGVPIFVHIVSASETVELEVFVTSKETSRSRASRLRGCRYQLNFTHPDIPKKKLLVCIPFNLGADQHQCATTGYGH